jgi:hypothetical protein
MPASAADAGELSWAAFRATRARFLAGLAAQSALVQLERAWRGPAAERTVDVSAGTKSDGPARG